MHSSRAAHWWIFAGLINLWQVATVSVPWIHTGGLSPAHRVVDAVLDTLIYVSPLLIMLLAWRVARGMSPRGHLWAAGSVVGLFAAEWMLHEVAPRLPMAVAGASGTSAGLSWFVVPGLVITAGRVGIVAAYSSITARSQPRQWRRHVLSVPSAVLALLFVPIADGPVRTKDEPSPALASGSLINPHFGTQSCDAPRREPLLRLPDVATTRRVEKAWRRLERWLAENAPQSYADLAPPATPREIARVEKAMMLRFPDDLKASLMRHNGVLRGAGSLLGMLYSPMSLSEIHSSWRALCDSLAVAEAELLIMSGDDPDSVAPEEFWWHWSVIPFAIDPAGDHLVLNGKGRVGEFFEDEGLAFTDDGGRPSYAALLEAVVRSLEKGEPLDMWVPTTTRHGTLEWRYETVN
ncbi:SMI1/KNR4 family protein [Sinosporangium siamense]|uniref:Knr4/Smi1-like domain-containing protein n=1 Tax=Sinosporangium siamense TaxID=1367973 RepID=A0A919RIZ2_9ACTN|nr:SMI1/KNR4 family protein [Sinosporangium siamense]GII94735.1 hypothetical protein Ssi02_49660 [Sinosporangium siamense]